jgi:DNA repair photolyase
MIAPVIPGLNDHEIPALLQAAAEAGARFAGWTMLRLPFAVKDIFASWLDRHYPERKDKVLGRIREVRDGKLNESSFGSRMRGTGRLAEVTARLFKLARQRAGIPSGGPTLSTASFRRPGSSQGLLFAELS